MKQNARTQGRQKSGRPTRERTHRGNGEAAETVQLSDIMTPHVEAVDPDASLQQTALKMKELDVGMIPVTQGDRILGILTDRDLTVRAIAEGRDPNSTRASEVMTTDVKCCYADQTAGEAADLMEREQIRRMLVIDRDEKLVGVVSLGDLALELEEPTPAEVLREVSRPARPHV